MLLPGKILEVAVEVATGKGRIFLLFQGLAASAAVRARQLGLLRGV
jgi:hypothetical protein